MKVYCNNCGKDVEPIDNKCPKCKLVFEEDNIENNRKKDVENTISLVVQIVAYIILVLGFIISLNMPVCMFKL